MRDATHVKNWSTKLLCKSCNLTHKFLVYVSSHVTTWAVMRIGSCLVCNILCKVWMMAYDRTITIISQKGRMPSPSNGIMLNWPHDPFPSNDCCTMTLIPMRRKMDSLSSFRSFFLHEFTSGRCLIAIQF